MVWGLRIKKYYGDSLKNLIFGGKFTKKPVYREDCLKRGWCF